ncbi:uncharacterized protein LOC143264125 isoform X3 [Megachile rotundata]|uniref:uncharacterized protein LOC143264125 isoform X3 n=1 Tax=Megachile rotundata TaxID=143995 RepID=UPI003FD23FE8
MYQSTYQINNQREVSRVSHCATLKHPGSLVDDGRTYRMAKKIVQLASIPENGIKRRLTAPHTPQQNGIAERKNRTLIEMENQSVFNKF